MTEFFDTGLLLGRCRLRKIVGGVGWHAAVEWAFPGADGRCGRRGRSGRHTPDVDAGADGAALNQRDLRALLDGLALPPSRSTAAQ